MAAGIVAGDMADVEQIRVEILATAAEFRKELDTAIKKLAGPGGLKEAIKDVPSQVTVDFQMQTAGAHSKLGKLRDAINDTKAQIERDASFGLDTGAARLKLDALDRRADAVKRKIAEDAALSAIGEGGGGIGGVLSGLPGSVGPASAGSVAGVTAAAPLVAAGAGGLTALAGSAGAGLLGAGALGVGAAGAGLVGVGSMLAVIKGGSEDIAKMGAAYEKLLKDQLAYGQNSKQAAQDQANINALVKLGSPLLLEIAKSLHNIGDEWQHVSEPAMKAMYGVILPALDTVRKLMPTVAGIAKTSFEAVGKGLQPVFATLSSPTFKKILLDLGSAFAHLAPPLIGAFFNIFQSLLQIAVAAAPFVVQLAKGFEALTRSWVVGTGNATELHGVIGGLVGQFKSWWDLAKAVGGLLVTLFSAGSSSGQSMVNMLTAVVREWTAWLNTKQGQADLKKFFEDSKKLIVAVFEVLGPLVKAVGELAIALIPAATWVVKLFNEIVVTDQIGKAFDWTIKALGATLGWIGEQVINALIGSFKLLKGAVDVLGDAWKSVWHAMQVAFAAVLNVLLGGFSSLLGAIASALHAADSADFAGIFGDKFSKAAKSVEGGQHAIDRFRESLQPAATDSQTTTKEIATAHETASKKIVSSWGNALGATRKGIGEINAAMLAELKSLNGGKVVALSQGGPPLAPGLIAAQEGKADGGYIGMPGERGHDDVPIVVGRGEAVLHAGHQQIVNQALAIAGVPGGLGEVFANTGGLHYNMAKGGYAGYSLPLPKSAMMPGSWSIDQGVDIPAGAGTPEFAIGPGQIISEGIQGFGSNAPVLRISAGPLAGRNIYYGHAGPDTVKVGQTVAAGQQISEVGAGKVGISSGPHIEIGFGPPFGHGDSMAGLLQQLMGGAGVTGVPGGAGAISRVKVKTPGAIGKVAQGAVDKARAAANKVLASQQGAGAGVGQAGVEGTASGGGVAAGSAQMRAWAKAGLIAAGLPGSSSEVSTIVYTMTRESGGNPRSENTTDSNARAGHPSRGLMELIPENFAKYHVAGTANDVFDPVANVAASVRYMIARYGHIVGMSPYARGGLVGMAAGGFAGGKLPKGAAGPKATRRAAKRPPAKKAPAKPKHAAVSHTKAAVKVSGLLPADIVQADQVIHGDQLAAAGADIEYQHLLDQQALTPTQALVTLTDADVAALDPDGKLGYQTGDELVNQHGMTVGRWFSPTGITGGTFAAGIDTRLGQINSLSEILQHTQGAVGQEAAADETMGTRETSTIGLRHDRAVRLRKMLAVTVARARRVQGQMEALTRGSLQTNLKTALSRQAIASRKGELQAHLGTLRGELTAERKHQSQLIPLDREPGYGESLQSQIAGVTGALSAESKLASGSSTSGAVAKAREAILRNSLGSQLKELGAGNVAVGGSATAVGTGGLLSLIGRQVEALRTDQDTHVNDLQTLGPVGYQLGQELAALGRESAMLGGTQAVQVRTPGTGQEKSTQLLALVQQQLATTQQELAVSQSQFNVFQGFEPLLAGRLVGSFASGIDRVSRTGPAIVHQGEVILPDPNGPYGNAAVAQARAGSQQPLEIVIVQANNDEALTRVIDGRMNQKSLRIVSDRGGQRSRLIAGVTRG